MFILVGVISLFIQAREKELKKMKAAQKAEAAKLQVRITILVPVILLRHQSVIHNIRELY